MHPEDIEGREFFVGLRGYERDEVRQFLTEVATEIRQLRDEVERVRDEQLAAPLPADPLEELGSNITAVLRTANESAASIVADAERSAATLVSDAETEAARIRNEASGLQADAERAVEAARMEAAGIIEDPAQNVRAAVLVDLVDAESVAHSEPPATAW